VFNDVLEFTHVAREVITFEDLQRLLSDTRCFQTHLSGKQVDKVIDQQREIG